MPSGWLHVGEDPIRARHVAEVRPRVIEDAVERFHEVSFRGTCDFLGECEAVLSLEDSPEKATALARLAGAALWYANNLREEQEQCREHDDAV